MLMTLDPQLTEGNIYWEPETTANYSKAWTHYHDSDGTTGRVQ